MSVATKAKIVALSEEGKSHREISRKVDFSHKSIIILSRKYRESGSLERRKGSGRSRSTSVRDDRQITRILRSDSFQSLSEIKEKFASTTGSQISTTTLHRRLIEQGYILRRSAKKPLLTPKMKKTRLK